MTQKLCQFPNRFKGATCPVCCYSLPWTAPTIPHAICGSASTCDGSEPTRANGPGIVAMGWSYASAVKRWIAAGSPRRTQERIDEVFAICEACPHFSNDKRPHCKLCGCSLSKAPDGLKNKIAMATESCPADQPLWHADV